MPVNLVACNDSKSIVLEGIISPDEVDQLHELVNGNPGIAVDLTACEHMHTAALQLILQLKVPVVSPPVSSFWHHFFKYKEEGHENGSAG